MMRGRVAAGVAGLLVMVGPVAACSSTSTAEGGGTDVAAVQVSTSEQPTYLWTMASVDGSLRGQDDENLRLVMSDVDRIVTRFADRPYREAQAVDIRDFLERWDGRFAGNPPNAVLSYHLREGQPPTQIVVTLTNPRYSEPDRLLTFDAVRIRKSADTWEDADVRVKVPEIDNPARTGPLAVFIDTDAGDVSTSSVSTTAPGSTELDAMYAAVTADRMTLLDQQIADQVEQMERTNQLLMDIDTAIDELTALAPGSTPSQRTLDTMAAAQVPVPSTWDATTTQAAITALRSALDDLQADSQIQMLRLQSLIAKRNETQDMLSGLYDDYTQSTKDTIVGNMR